ncbi:MAG: MOSC domain-containing protein [Candidatus Omnitrophica bacterium]|nr:MOSC domain-containing protein [Candidatus Omnitrophota bacterium]
MDNPTNIPMVVSINISGGGIPKWPVDSVRVGIGGLEGDGHNHAKHYRLEQAVSLQDIEQLAELRHEGYALHCGSTGENISVGHLNVNALPLGTVLDFSGGVQLEITKVRHPCYVLDAIDPRLKEVIIGRCGMYAKVVREGILRAGERIEVVQPAAVMV